MKKYLWLVSLGAAVAALGACSGRGQRVALRLNQAAAVFEHTREAILITDAQRRIVAVNPAFTAITGYTAAEVVGKNPRLQHSGRQDAAFYRRMWDELNETGQWEGEIWNRRKNGEVYAAWENITAIREGDGPVVQYVAVMADITPLAHAQERLMHTAHHDVLTGLPNRLMLAATLQKALERAKRHGYRLAVLFVDLDRFKSVNDMLGHAVGDTLLQEVAHRLQHAVRSEDMVARLSGDEFLVVFEDLSERDEAVQLAKKITAALGSHPFVSGRHSIGVSASVGIALYPDDGDTAEALLGVSDAAMYKAKQSARCGRPASDVL